MLLRAVGWKGGDVEDFVEALDTVSFWFVLLSFWLIFL
jgi:hypothetical protein